MPTAEMEAALAALEQRVAAAEQRQAVSASQQTAAVKQIQVRGRATGQGPLFGCHYGLAGASLQTWSWPLRGH